MTRGPAIESRRFRSFDGGHTEQAPYTRPDRYRLLEQAVRGGVRAVRGGGYSYCAASFGGGALVVDVTRFDRVLRFEPERRLVEVEAGITLADLFGLTAPAGLWLEAQPGYPAITVGGCIATNAHGKNPRADGTFLAAVEELTLLHPRHGLRRLRRGEPHFELTAGGFGLTGVVVSATLRLAPVPGPEAEILREPVRRPEEALARLQAAAGEASFAYSWQSATPTRSFGRGFVFTGQVPAGPPPARPAPCPPLDADLRARLPVSLLGRRTAEVFSGAFRGLQRLTPARRRVPVFDALFPLARRRDYFMLFGRRGLVEYQSLVPAAAAADYLRAVERAVLSSRPPAVMQSLKLFRGRPRHLRFEGDGVCVTLDLARHADTAAFLPRLDALTLDAGGIVNLVKDSRATADLARRCYPEYDLFRDALRAYDPERLFRSELSERLEL